ncbi:MAG: FAD-binding oxidoreductase [Ignavibacteria bacterium]|nr:FAD-binding oxidoreductase [Ignavibacteria bacterium]
MIVKTSPDEFQDFIRDASNFTGNCSAVYIPQTPDEIPALLTGANEKGIPVTISGGGTGITGGRCPNEGIVLSTGHLNKIITIDNIQGIARVQAGVILHDLQCALDQQGLFYPPDPTETNCCIGGTIATNASGARSFLYGPTRRFVKELSVILPDGTPVTLKRGERTASPGTLILPRAGGTMQIPIPEIAYPAVKNAAGYYLHYGMDAIDLFIGAEGTLGVITEAVLGVLPRPQCLISCVAFFPDSNSALEFIDFARQSGNSVNNIEETTLQPRALEFFDEHSLNFLRTDFPNIPETARAAVWFEQEATSDTEESLLDLWMDLIITTNGLADDTWYAADAAAMQDIHTFRHAISAKVNEFVTSRGLRKIGTDTAVPHRNFAGYYHQITELAAEAGLYYVAYGHFGDFHVHLNFLPKNTGELEVAQALYDKICMLAVSMGGTISAEHGVGKAKKHLFHKMYGPGAIAQMQIVKSILDPANILNRGNLF